MFVCGKSCQLPSARYKKEQWKAYVMLFTVYMYTKNSFLTDDCIENC